MTTDPSADVLERLRADIDTINAAPAETVGAPYSMYDAIATIKRLSAELERLNQLALDGVNMGIATGIELSAEWLTKNIDRLSQHNVKSVAQAMIAEVCEGKPAALSNTAENG